LFSQTALRIILDLELTPELSFLIELDVFKKV